MLRRVAALAPDGAGWSFVVATNGAKGPEIVHADRLGTLDPAGVRRAMSTHRAERLIRVIPPGEAVVRMVELPEGDAASAGAAAELIAEAQLPSAIQPYRRGGSVLALPTESGGQAALLAGWLGSDAPARLLEDDNEEFWTPTAGALAGLLEFARHRKWEDQPGWAATRSGPEQAATIVAASRAGTRVRSARLADPDGAIRAATEGAVQSWAKAVEIDPMTEAALAEAASAGGSSGSWGLSHAVAAGAALGALRAGSEGGAFRLRAEPPRFSFSLPERAAMTLGKPSVGGLFLIAGLLLLIGGPLALTQWRTQVITDKLERAEASAGDVQAADTESLTRNKNFVEHLATLRVAYTKSIAAIAASMPVGDDENPFAVQVERIEISPETLRIRGEASSRDAVQEFASALRGIGIFRVDPENTRDDTNSGLVQFDIEGAPVDTFADAAIPDGFATEPFAVRLFGEDAIGYDYASITQIDGAAAGTARPGRTRPGRTSGAGFDSVTNDDGDDEPSFPELTEEQISEMDESTARREFTSRFRGSRTDGLDSETVSRLQRDVELLRARLRELQGR